MRTTKWNERKSALVKDKTIAGRQVHPEARLGEAETRLSPGRGSPSPAPGGGVEGATVRGYRTVEMLAERRKSHE